MSTLLGTLAIVDHIAPNVTEKEKDISDIRKKIQQEEALLQEMFEEFCERSESVNYLKKTRSLVVDLMRYVPADKSEEADRFLLRYLPPVIELLKNPEDPESEKALKAFSSATEKFTKELYNTEEKTDVNADYLMKLIARDGLGEDLIHPKDTAK